MRIASLFTAESARLANETLQVQGGLWDGLTASAFPATHEIVTVVLLRPEPEDVGPSFHLDFPVTGPDGTQVGHQHVDVTVHVWKHQVALVVPVAASFPTAGRYVLGVSASFGSDEISFDVVGPGMSSVAEAVDRAVRNAGR